MAQILSYDTDGVTTEHWGSVREGKIAGITTKTDQGTVATSPVNIPDPAGSLVIRGLRRAYISESDCPTDFNVIYDGYLGPRTYGRDAEHFIGSRRVIGATLVDHNTLLTNYLIQGTKDAAHGDRPEETDLERIAWLLASAFTHPIQDFGAIATTGGVTMDAADLRGQNAGNVFRDCGLMSGRNHFLYYYEAEPTEQRIGLFYNRSSAPVWNSTLRLSNHPGDADDIRDPDAITFELDSEQPPVMTRKPDWIASDVLIDYDGGQLFVACEDVGLTTRDDYYVKQLVVPAPNVKTAAAALRLATQQLRDHSTEQDVASCRVLLPSSHIGLIQPGHRIEGRFDHFEPEYRDFIWWRIQEHAWAQRGRKWYWLDLTLEPVPETPMSLILYRSQSADTSGSTTPIGWVCGGDGVDDGLSCNSGSYPAAPHAGPLVSTLGTIGGTIATITYLGLEVTGTGTIDIAWGALGDPLNALQCFTACGGITVLVELLKNGVMVASSSLVTPGGGSGHTMTPITLTSEPVVPGDLFTARMSHSGGCSIYIDGGHLIVTGVAA